MKKLSKAERKCMKDMGLKRKMLKARQSTTLSKWLSANSITLGLIGVLTLTAGSFISHGILAEENMKSSTIIEREEGTTGALANKQEFIKNIKMSDTIPVGKYTGASEFMQFINREPSNRTIAVGEDLLSKYPLGSTLLIDGVEYKVEDICDGAKMLIYTFNSSEATEDTIEKKVSLIEY